MLYNLLGRPMCPTPIALQIIGAAQGAPAAPLPTPMVYMVPEKSERGSLCQIWEQQLKTGLHHNFGKGLQLHHHQNFKQVLTCKLFNQHSWHPAMGHCTILRLPIKYTSQSEDEPQIRNVVIFKGACSDPQPHPPWFFHTYGDFGTSSWVIFRRLCVWSFMHKLSVVE